MKKIISIIIILFATSIYSQSINLTDLVALSKSNIDEFDDLVSSKGYKYYKSENSDYTKSISYVYDLKSNNTAEHFITRNTTIESKKTSIAFQTTKIEYYIIIKQELKKMGFKFIGDETDEKGNLVFNYKKENIELILYNIKIPKSNEIVYEISITNLN